jgi:hypothetical protein
MRPQYEITSTALKVTYRRSYFAVVLFLIMTTTAGNAAATFQDTPVSKPSASPTPDADRSPTPKPAGPGPNGKEKRGSLIFAPIPINSPTFGVGLIVAVGYVFKLDLEDSKSPASTIGAAVAFTDSGSRGLVMGGRLYFHENKYQTAFAFGKGRANYDFYGIGRVPGTDGVAVEIRQSGAFIFGEFMRNFGKNIFIGPRYQYRRLTAARDSRTTPGGFVIPELDIVSKTAAVGVHVQRDLRDQTFYTRKGSLLDFKADFFSKAVGSNRNYQTYSMSYAGFRSLSEKRVLAYRAMGCAATREAPFYDLCLFGSSSNLRGYTVGEFQDRRMFAVQAELRQELRYRLGIVGFAGIGGIAPEINKFRFDKLLPAAGVGLRFKLDKKNHINYRIDLGFGRSGPTLSMSVTEAF